MISRRIYDVCTKCGYHFRMNAYDRINTLIDGDFTEIGSDVLPGDPLGWVDKKTYPEKLAGDREKSGISEGVVCGFGTIDGFDDRAGRDGLPLSRRHDGHGRRRADHACSSRKRASGIFPASSLPRRAARAWKRGCSR